MNRYRHHDKEEMRAFLLNRLPRTPLAARSLARSFSVVEQKVSRRVVPCLVRWPACMRSGTRPFSVGHLADLSSSRQSHFMATRNHYRGTFFQSFVCTM